MQANVKGNHAMKSEEPQGVSGSVLQTINLRDNDQEKPMDAYYQQAIDILMSDSDWKQLCIAMAKNHPKEFCEASGAQPWQVAAFRINNAEGKVPAIKYIRSVTGMGLKEAKETLEKLAV